MKLHRLRILAAVAAAALVAVPGVVPAADPYEITVITSLTGQSALGGKQTADSLHVLETRLNRGGGIGGRPIRFAIQDDQTNPQVAITLANAAIAKKVPVILGPQIAANCNAVFPLVSDGPVMWCLSPGFHPPKGSYGFSSNASTAALVTVTVRYFRALGMTKIALLASTDASGQDGEHNLDAALALPEMSGVSLVAREHFNVTDVSVAAQMAHIAASGAQALIVWTTLTPLATALRGYKDAGLQMPVATVNANASAAQLRTYAGFMPDTLLIAAMLNQVPDQVPGGAVKRKVAEFYDGYASVLGFRPEGSANLSWDAAQIIVAALQTYGPNASARQIRDYIEGLHGWVGINGVYDFRDGSQRGLGENNVVMTRWDPVRLTFSAVSKPGGLPPT